MHFGTIVRFSGQSAARYVQHLTKFLQQQEQCKPCNTIIFGDLNDLLKHDMTAGVAVSTTELKVKRQGFTSPQTIKVHSGDVEVAVVYM